MSGQAAYLCVGDANNTQLINSQGQAFLTWTWQPGYLNALTSCNCYVQNYTRDDLRCDGDRNVTNLVNSENRSLIRFQYAPGTLNAASQCREYLRIRGYNECSI